MTTPTTLAEARKAVVAAVSAAAFAVVGTLGAALTDGVLTGPEVGTAIGAGLLAAAATGGVTYATTNAPAPGGSRRP